MKPFLLVLFFSIAFHSFNQSIVLEGTIESKELDKNSPVISKNSQGDLLIVTRSHVKLYNCRTGELKQKSWQDFDLKEVKYKLKYSSTSIEVSKEFETVACNFISDDLVALAVSNQRTEDVKLIKFRFDKDLNLLEESILASFPAADKKSGDISTEDYYFKKSTSNDFCSWTKISSYKKKVGRKGRIESFVFDSSFLQLSHYGAELLGEEMGYMEDVLIAWSISILDQGDVVIKVENQFYLVETSSLQKFELDIERSLDSYVMLQSANKNILIVGTYHEGSDNKTYGGAVIEFKRSNLSVHSELYLPFDSRFSLSASDLMHEQLNTPERERKELGFKNKGKLEQVNNAYLLGAFIAPNGNVRGVFSRSVVYSVANSMSQNLCIVEMGDNDFIHQEIVPHEFDSRYRNKTTYFMPIFGKNMTTVVACNYPKYYNEKTYKFEPKNESITFKELGSGVDIAILFDHNNESLENKMLVWDKSKSENSQDFLVGLTSLTRLQYPKNQFIALLLNENAERTYYGKVILSE